MARILEAIQCACAELALDLSALSLRHSNMKYLCVSFLFIALPIFAADSPKAADAPVGTAPAKELPLASKQFPDVASLPDRTEEFRKQISESGGTLLLPPGVSRITGTLEFVLAGEHSGLVKPEKGPATLIMDGAGPAIRFTGSHEGSASPSQFKPTTFNERMPTVEGIEIIGNHPEADGIELYRTFETIITKTSVRWCRHAIHLVERNRNLVVSDVHLYENSGVGIFYDDVNIHQSNISNSHISYNRKGGIVIRDGQIRNMQVSGCDIEANVPEDDTPTDAANILIDVSGTPDDKSRSVAEVVIVGCTLQHLSNYTGKNYKELAPGGANIRFRGKEIYPIDTVSIIGNVMSDVTTNVELVDCNEIILSGNVFFAPNPDNLLITRGKRINVTGNAFNPREFERPGRIVFDQCVDSIFANNTLRGLLAPEGAVVIKDSARINLSNNVLTESLGGISVQGSKDISVRGWMVSGLPEGTKWLNHDAASERVVEEGNVVASQ